MYTERLSIFSQFLEKCIFSSTLLGGRVVSINITGDRLYPRILAIGDVSHGFRYDDSETVTIMLIGAIWHSFMHIQVGSLEKKNNYIRKFDGMNFTIWKQCMMDVLVKKGLAAPLKDHKKSVYNDDQWEELDARARATIRLHLGESIFFTIMDKTTDFEFWDSLCSAWDGKSASNKVFLMKKLMRLSMKEGSNVSSHLNEFNALYSQLTFE
ncbi:hypothetical protein L7F22_053132 [Adiantum nelumboides]|nr:hypothetical protein [Adiantum nelumboides]